MGPEEGPANSDCIPCCVGDPENFLAAICTYQMVRGAGTRSGTWWNLYVPFDRLDKD